MAPNPSGGKAVLATTNPSADDYEEADLEVITLRTGASKTVWKGGYFGRYLPNGRLVFFRERVLFGVRFDLQTLEVRGAPVPLIEDVAVSSSSGNGSISFNDGIDGAGTAVYLAGAGATQRRLAWVDSAGSVQVLGQPGEYFTPRIWSPDGRHIVFGSQSQPFTLW